MVNKGSNTFDLDKYFFTNRDFQVMNWAFLQWKAAAVTFPSRTFLYAYSAQLMT